jgi:hypothetical protein
MLRNLILVIGIVCSLLSGLSAAKAARAQGSPTLTKNSPATRTRLLRDSVDVTPTGIGFTPTMTLGFDPPGVVDETTAKQILKETMPHRQQWVSN